MRLSAFWKVISSGSWEDEGMSEEPAGPKMKAEIRAIGLCCPHAPDEHGRIWTAANWHMEGGDFPGADFTTGRLGGWTMAELALLSYIARAAGYDEALRLAGEYRTVAPDGYSVFGTPVRMTPGS
jgi:hypothetical protein